MKTIPHCKYGSLLAMGEMVGDNNSGSQIKIDKMVSSFNGKQVGIPQNELLKL